MSFIDEVIQDILVIPAKAGTSPPSASPQTLFFPHPKALRRFQERLQTYSQAYAPALYVLEEWVIAKSQLTVAAQATLITRLYKIIKNYYPAIEPLDRFYGWGSVLLQDFDWIDRCLVNADHLFKNLYQQKSLDRSYDYLTEQQREAIRTFWKSFGKQLSTQQQAFLDMISILSTVYKALQDELETAGIGYTGLCYKQIKTHSRAFPPPRAPIAFVGFNYLNPAEEKLIANWHQQTILKFYWDIDAYYMEDTRQEAGYYLRAHSKKTYYRPSFTQPYPDRINNPTKDIHYIPCHTRIGQIQQALKGLETCFRIHQPTPHQVVLVLADETLLLPLVTAWPAHLPPFSTSMGYPLRQTLTYQLVELLLTLQIARHQANCLPGYGPTQLVQRLLHHPFIKTHEPLVVQQILATLSPTSIHCYIPSSLLAEHFLLEQVLGQSPPNDSVLIIQGITHTLNIIAKASMPYISTYYTWIPDESIAINALQETLQQLVNCLAASHTCEGEDGGNHPSDRLFALFVSLVQDRQLPFAETSHPSPIPILRMDETALIDADYVFILGMNEGSFPPSPTKGSYIPYNLRKAYHLPTLDTFQPAIAAYLFYRLLQRAQQVWITYNLPTPSNHQKEMSRYLLQLRYESHVSIDVQQPSTSITLPRANTLTVSKDPSVMILLHNLINPSTPDQSSLTPTALNTYIDCSLQFYFRYLSKLQSRSVPSSESTRFGNLLHAVMEKLYTPWAGATATPVQAADIKALQKDIKSYIQAAFSNYYQPLPTDPIPGQQLIEQAVMEKIIHQLLILDLNKAPFRILGLEMGKKTPLRVPFTLPSGMVVYLEGIIDRIDLHQGTVQVIDYKTNKHDMYASSIESLFEQSNKRRNKAMLQLLFYTWLIKKSSLYPSYVTVTPHLIQVSKIFEPIFDPRLLLPGLDQKNSTPMNDLTPYQETFEKNLATLLNELLDPSIPFSQTPNRSTCLHCPYQRICLRY